MDSVNLKGSVSVYQEDDEGNREYIIDNRKNHFVNAMLKGLTSYFCGLTLSSSNCWAYDAFIVIGSDVLTPTTFDMTALYIPTGGGIGTLPNTTGGDGITTDGNGSYKMDFFSTWNAETISGRIGEIGLYLRPFTVLTPQWNSANAPAQAMCSRLAVADGAFEPFDIDTSRSLTVKWEVSINYV